MIKLHNSMSRFLEPFYPIDINDIGVYACGPTVYDTPHIGNARPAIIVDILVRVLRSIYGQGAVNYVRNYTDIDDKIISRANENGESIYELTERVIGDYEAVMEALGNVEPTATPRATQYMPEIIGQIEQIIANGHAYVSEGHVLFDVSSWPDHGILSQHKQENLTEHRIEEASYKRNRSDFVLWKPSELRQPGWDNPWGKLGRPGWHIECSSMIASLFDSQRIDIHAGGEDLRFPHHECEISQYGAAYDERLANYWIHNGLITVNGSKMAKSANNFVTVKQELEMRSGQTVRLALITSHYRASLDWTFELLEQAHKTLTDWHSSLLGMPGGPTKNDHADAILEPLKNDLNTPLAISKIHEALSSPTEDVASGVRYAASIMGIDLVNNEYYLHGSGRKDRKYVEKMIDTRNHYRKDKDYVQADRIREILGNYGVVIEDSPSGTTWRVTY